MTESGKTIGQIDACLARVADGDQTAWDELFQHAFDRLLDQCGRIVHRTLTRPNPLITENAVLAETYQRLCKAMQSDKVNPTTAREFFGLAAQHIRWQIQDMLRKRSSQQAGTDVFMQITGGTGPATGAEENEKWEQFWFAVDSLSDEEREVFDMIWINGLSQYETADTLGKTRNQVDTIWRRVKIAIVKGCQGYDAFGS